MAKAKQDKNWGPGIIYTYGVIPFDTLVLKGHFGPLDFTFDFQNTASSVSKWVET